MGTSAWCSNVDFYKTEGYNSEEECFWDREAKQPWQYLTSDCRGDFADCSGTDAICGRIQSVAFRTKCFMRYAKAAFLHPSSEGCLAMRWYDDERCMGTTSFCESNERRQAYGSSEACLGYRRQQSTTDGKRLPALGKNFMKCTGDNPEGCIGTETFCMSQGKEQGLQCLASREKLPFYPPESSACGGMGVSPNDEVCVGTRRWCSDHVRVRMYGTEQSCIDAREKPKKLPWFEPADPCIDPGRNDTEACRGTEATCQFNEECFQARDPGPFLLANKVDCGGAKKEKCMGSWRWCHSHYQLAQYYDEHDCFSRRSFDARKLAERVMASFKPLFRNAIIKAGANVTYGAVLRTQVLRSGDEQELALEVHKSMADFLAALAKNEFREALVKYLDRVAEMASKAS